VSLSLSLESLRCFAEAARLLNFRAAARAVALSPPAFGQRIRQLEADLDVRLFHRTTRAVLLTEEGLRLLPYAHRALDAVAECRRVRRGPASPAPLEVVLGTRHELGLSWILPLRESLEQAQVGLTVHLYFGSGADLVARVRGVAIDCAVTSTRLTDPKLDSIRLHREDYVFVGAPRLLRRVPLRRATEAHGHTLFDITAELPLFHYWRDAPGGVDSLRFGRIVQLGTIAAIRELVLQGQGIAVLPRYLVEPDLRRRRLTTILPRVSPLFDYFRLVFRADDPRRALYTKLAAVMNVAPIR
jgi:LysR family transcriptional regulator, glycine cleavage system transcriptional activator